MVDPRPEVEENPRKIDDPTRRRVLALGAGAAALILGRSVAFGRTREPAGRSLSLRNLHTGERIRATYWENGRYLPDALGEIDHILRDYRSNEVTDIDRGLLDLLNDLHTKIDTSEPFEVISGYRSPTTNAALHRAGRGVAKNSLHTLGRAIDVRVPGRELDVIRKAAISLQRGGVGYYAGQFVHVDVGRVRTW